MIENVMNMYKTTPDHHKRQVLSTLYGLVDLKHLQRQGFKISKRTWTNAMNHAKTKGPGVPVDPPKRPPSKSLSPETATAIVEFVKKHSKHCPNRFVSVKKKLIAVMELEGTTAVLVCLTL
jgi:hypothetical protein